MKEQINNLIAQLIAIKEFSKDIHYTCHGEAFYAKHLLADKFNFEEHIDLLKECCLLGNGERPLGSLEYLKNAIEYLIYPNEQSDKNNFEFLGKLINETLNQLDNIETNNKADSSILDSIAQDLQQYKGLLNLQLY